MTEPRDSLTPLVLVSELRGRINASTTAADVAARLLTMITEQSAIFQQACRRRFDEYVETRYYTPFHLTQGGDLFDLRSLRLDADLKSAPANTTIINGDGSTIVAGNMQFRPLNSLYKQVVRLNPYGIQFWYHAGVTDPVGSISVNGTWGFGGSWIATGTTVNNGGVITIGASSFTSSASPALEAGMVIQLDSEQLYVSAVNSTTISVARGFNGTSPAQHSDGLAINRWQANSSVRQLVTRLVLMALEQDKSPLFGQIAIGDNVRPIQADSWPKDVIQAVQTNSLKRIPRLQSV